MNQERRVIEVFDKQTGNLVKNVPIEGLSLRHLRELFNADKNDDMFGSFPIKNFHIIELFERFFDIQFDLDNYNYYLSCYANE
jgi:hypothetical protein